MEATAGQGFGPGSVIGRKYRVDRVIGEGGMGIVALATHLTLKTQFAIKIILPEYAASPEAKQRLMEEAQNAGKIPGDHVVRVVDADVLPDGLAYLAMEFLEGHDLAEAIQWRGKLPFDEVIGIGVQACSALEGAHGLGIVHRDIKPSNVFLTKRGDGSLLVKILDFGISKDTANKERGDITSTTFTLGSPLYMSPEQMTNPKSVDGRSDIWSLGVVLFEALAGATPFEAETMAGLSIAIATTEPRDLRTLAPEVPDALLRVVARCLEKSRDKRFATAGELKQALLDAAGVAVPPTSARTSLPSIAEGRVAAAAPHVTAGGGLGQTVVERPRAAGGFLGRIVAGTAVAACVAAAIGFFLVRGSSSDVPAGAPVPTAPSAVPSASASSEAVVVTPVEAANIDALPAAQPTATGTKKTKGTKPEAAPKVDAAPKADVPKADHAKSDCSPPYSVDANGVKRFKPQCM